MADQSIILITRGGKLTALPETTQLDFGEGKKGEGKGRRETETPPTISGALGGPHECHMIAHISPRLWAC